MTFFNLITENLILPGTDILLGKQISKKLKFLKKSQYWSQDEIINFQNHRLQLLIEHSYENVPFYTELFDDLKLKPKDIREIADLNKLPILTKKTIRENIKAGKLLATNINPKNLLRNSSSGSTGEPLQFYETKSSDDMKKAAAIRGWNWMGYRLGDKFIKISQIPRKGRLKKIQDKISRSYYIYAFQLDDSNFKSIVSQIISNKPKILRCYPDPLLLLSRYIKKNDLEISGIEAINTTGSMLPPETRKIAEEVFKCKIYDSFSCEGGASVFECSNHECYHSSAEYAITEVLDEKGKCTNKGRLITTDLWNYATPFIRYDTQDIIELSESGCSCGRGLLTIKKILGRNSDILVTPKGQFLIVNNFTGHFQWISEIEQFQIHQKSIDSFDINLKVSNKYNKNIENKIYEIVKKIISEDVKIQINILDDIPLEKSGKRRFLIRDDTIELPNQ